MTPQKATAREPRKPTIREREYYLRGLLWHAIHKNHPYSPASCSPCEEINKELVEYIKPERALKAGR